MIRVPILLLIAGLLLWLGGCRDYAGTALDPRQSRQTEITCLGHNAVGTCIAERVIYSAPSGQLLDYRLRKTSAWPKGLKQHKECALPVPAGRCAIQRTITEDAFDSQGVAVADVMDAKVLAALNAAKEPSK